MNVIEPRRGLSFADSFLAICISGAPSPPKLRARWQRSTLAHFPRPFRVDGLALCKLWEGFSYYFTACLLFVAIFQHNGFNICFACDRGAEGGCFWKVEDDFVVRYVRKRGGEGCWDG